MPLVVSFGVIADIALGQPLLKRVMSVANPEEATEEEVVKKVVREDRAGANLTHGVRQMSTALISGSSQKCESIVCAGDLK